jgi:serine protease Do
MAARKSGFFVGAVAGAGVACAALAGVGMRMGARGRGRAGPGDPHLGRSHGQRAPMFAPPPGAPMSFADIFEQVSPAVVQIDVTSKAAAAPKLRIPGLEGFDIVPGPEGRGRRGSAPVPSSSPRARASSSRPTAIW